MAVALVAVGIVGLTLFLFCVWPPLALLPVSVGALTAGVVVDWRPDGKSSAPPDQPTP